MRTVAGVGLARTGKFGLGQASRFPRRIKLVHDLVDRGDSDRLSNVLSQELRVLQVNY